MAEYKSSSIDKVQYQGLEIQKIYVGSELFWPIAEGSGGSDPGDPPTPTKQIVSLEITSFIIDEVPWDGGAIVKHLEYLITYDDDSTETSNSNITVSYTNGEDLPVNDSILRGNKGTITVNVSTKDGAFTDEASATIWQAAIPAKSINLNTYDVDNIPAEGGTISTLNSYYVAVEYMNNKTYFYTSTDRITYKNSVTAGASTNTSEHLVGYLQFTFTCPYIDNSLDFSVLVYQDAYIPVVETRLAYMQLITSSSSSTNLYALRTETGEYFTFADLFSNDGVFNICAGIQSSGTQYVLKGNGSTSDQLAIAITSSGWWVYDEVLTNSYYSTDGTPNRNFFKILFTLNENGTFLLKEYTNETFPTLGWNNINTSSTLNSPVFFNQVAQVYYIQIGDFNSNRVLLPYVNSNNERYFKDVITGKKYFLNESSSLSIVSYDRMNIEPDTNSIQINKIPYSGGNYEETLDYWHTFVNVKIDSTVSARYFHTSAYNTITFSKTGTCQENINTEEVNVGLQVATFKLFDFYDDPKTCTYSYNMTLEANPARSSYMTNYNLCYAVWQELYEGLSITINGDGSNVHPKKAPDTYAIPLDISDSNDSKLMNGGMVMAVVKDTYTSDTLTKNLLYYYNSGVYKDKMYRIYNSYVYYFENPSYYLSIIANGTKYNLSGWHNDSVSNKYQYEWKFDATKEQTASDVLSNCPWTNIFLWCESLNSVNSGSGSSTITCKVMPGFEYYQGSTYVTQIKLYIYPTRLEIWEADDKGVCYVSALKSWTLSSSFSYFITLAVPVKPTAITSIPIHFKFPERGIMWIGTPE